MRLLCSLNLFGNATLELEFNPPHAFNGMLISFVRKEPFNALFNYEIRNLVWEVETNIYRANAFPVGISDGSLTLDQQIDILTEMGWKLKKKLGVEIHDL